MHKEFVFTKLFDSNTNRSHKNNSLSIKFDFTIQMCGNCHSTQLTEQFHGQEQTWTVWVFSFPLLQFKTEHSGFYMWTLNMNINHQLNVKNKNGFCTFFKCFTLHYCWVLTYNRVEFGKILTNAEDCIDTGTVWCMKVLMSLHRVWHSNKELFAIRYWGTS